MRECVLILHDKEIALEGFEALNETAVFHLLSSGITISKKSHNTVSDYPVTLSENHVIQDEDLCLILKERGFEKRTKFLLIEDVYYQDS